MLLLKPSYSEEYLKQQDNMLIMISYTKYTILLKAQYCPRAMPVQHFVNPGQLVQAVSCTQKNQRDLDL